jgi:hypothetical protein
LIYPVDDMGQLRTLLTSILLDTALLEKLGGNALYTYDKILTRSGQCRSGRA